MNWWIGDAAFCSLIHGVFISTLQWRTVNSFCLRAGGRLTHQKEPFWKNNKKNCFLCGGATMVISCPMEELGFCVCSSNISESPNPAVMKLSTPYGTFIFHRKLLIALLVPYQLRFIQTDLISSYRLYFFYTSIENLFLLFVSNKTIYISDIGWVWDWVWRPLSTPACTTHILEGHQNIYQIKSILAMERGCSWRFAESAYSTNHICRWKWNHTMHCQLNTWQRSIVTLFLQKTDIRVCQQPITPWNDLTGIWT